MVGKYVPISKFTTSGMLNQPSQLSQHRSTLTPLDKVPTRNPTQKDNLQTTLSQSDQVLRDFNAENHQSQHVASQGTTSTTSNVQPVLMHSNPDQASSEDLDEAAKTSDHPNAEAGLLGLVSTATTHTFAEVIDFSKGFSSTYRSVEHKPDVKPIFLGFKRVAHKGSKIPLI